MNQQDLRCIASFSFIFDDLFAILTDFIVI